MEKIGEGGEKSVYMHPKNPEQVVGIYHAEIPPGGEAEVRARFYLTRIMHILFPKNVPDVALSVAYPNMIIRKRADFGKDHRTIQTGLHLLPKSVSDEELADAENAIEDDERVWALKKEFDAVGVNYDRTPQNYGIDEKGDAQYAEAFDVFHAGKNGTFFRLNDVDKLKKAIEKIEGEDKKRALVFLDRLSQIIEEENARVIQMGEEQ